MITQNDWEITLSSAIGNYSSLGSRPWEKIAKIELFPGVHVGDSAWIVPESLVPPGALRRLSSRTIVPSCFPHDKRPAPDFSLHDQSLRRSLLAMALPRRTLTGIRRLKASSWLSRVRLILRMARWVVALPPSADETLWSHLDHDDWKRMRKEVGTTPRVRLDISAIARDLAELGERGVLLDYPRKTDSGSEREITSAPTPEPSRRYAETPVLRKAQTGSRSEPFSDEFVTVVIGRAIWLQDNLAHQLVDCWRQLRAQAENAEKVGRSTAHPSSIEERRHIIKTFPWRDASGDRLEKLPWEMTWAREKTTTSSWPPRDAISINIMVGVLQALNYCATSFCIGGRSSEVLDASDDSIRPDDPERFHGTTFKPSEDEFGWRRDWPLHPRALKALEIQREIAQTLRRPEDTHLWVLLQDGAEPAGSPIRNVNEPVVQAVSKLGLNHLTGGTRPHSHRWRHTVARLVALCVAAAPQVLMDLFGHRDLEMTLEYLLSDPMLVAEVQRIAEEIAYATAEEALIDVEAGAAGGAAAAPLKEAITTLKMRRGEKELGAESLPEAIRILSYNGQPWDLVRPGILCTKGLGKFGPCTQGRGDADPGSCRADCTNRLELARAKADCSASLRMLLREHADAKEEERQMMLPNIEGQILAHLMRWDDVRENVIAESQLAKAIWASRRDALEPRRGT